MHEDGLFAWDCARILVGNPTAQLWVMGDALISDRGLADRRGQLSHKKNFEVPLINRCDNGGPRNLGRTPVRRYGRRGDLTNQEGDPTMRQASGVLS